GDVGWHPGAPPDRTDGRDDGGPDAEREIRGERGRPRRPGREDGWFEENRSEAVRECADEEPGGRDAEWNTEGAAYRAEDGGLAEQERSERAAPGADAAEEAELLATLRERQLDGVVDEEGADEQADDRERGEERLEPADHHGDVGDANAGRLDAVRGSEALAHLRGDGVRVGVLGEDEVDLVDEVPDAEDALRRIEIHDREATAVRLRGPRRPEEA